MTTTVAVLGTGIMGTGMARNLIAAGCDVTAWNRSPDRARPLADVGARVVTDAAEAVAGADVVLTMLYDADSVAEVMEWALPAVAPDAVWAQASTVGLDGTQRLAELAARHDVAFVDAPVLGTRAPAEQGTLTVLASGPEALRERVTPVFDAVGSRTIWVSERPGDAQGLKLVANAWVGTVTAGTAQSVALAQALGLDPKLFLDVISGGPLDLPYAQIKGKAMIADDYPVSFALSGVVKDIGLITAAMRGADVSTALGDGLAAAFAAAEGAGHGEEDMAAVVYAFRRPKP